MVGPAAAAPAPGAAGPALDAAGAALEIRDLEVVYAGVILALRGVSLRASSGRCTAVLGANGAGKSTLLKAVSGMLASENGRVLHGGVWWDGQPVHGRSPLDLVARGIVHVMEGRRVLRHLSVEQNLVIGGHAAPSRGELKRRLEEVCDTVPILGRLYRRTAGLLSGGEQQLLVIGRAMMARPRLLLIDEPSLGLAPKTVDQVFELLDMLRKRGMGIVLVEQNARVALQVADDACVLENGRVAIGGSAQDLRENDDVKAFYMGLHASGERRRLLETVVTRRRRDFGRALARSERHEERQAVA